MFRLLLCLCVLSLLVCGAASGALAPSVGDEGLEPRERRLEAAVGVDSLNLAFRVGYPRRTGVGGVLSVQTRWIGGWTTVGAGACYRLFGGYPLRLILRADAQLGLGPIQGPSLGLRLVPGVAAEVGREGRVSATVGISRPYDFMVLPDRVRLQSLALDGVLSVPVRDKWRAGLGAVVEQRTQQLDSTLPTYTLNAFVGVGRWL